MLQPSTPLPAKWANVLKFITFLLVAVYLLNSLSPLRFHVDMIRYFAIKDCLEFGCPPDSVAAKDYLPYGYTFLLLGLSKAGILSSFTVVLINCAYLLAGLYFTKRLFESKFYPYALFALVLLNWTTIKFVVHPLSEMQYVFFSLGALFFFQQYSLHKKIGPLLLAFAFGALAFFTRTVGVALIAALVTGVLWEYKQQILDLLRKHRIIIFILLGLVVLVVVFSRFLGLDHYTGVLTKQFEEGANFSTILKWHFTELAEISLNTSIARLNTVFPPAVSSFVFVSLGVLYLAALIYLLFIRKNQLPFIVKAYLVYYSVLMFNWPFYDPRFWVPVVPLFAALICDLRITRKTTRLVLSIPLAAYAIAGIASIGYMTYTSLNKEMLAKRHANGVYRNEYETFFYGKPQSDTAVKTDPYLIELLKKHH